jgi:peroxiredoxin
MGLEDELASLRHKRKALYSPPEIAAFEAALERLRMLQLAEHGPQPGDVFPDFALPDRSGRIVRSEALLAAGPLVVVFFRGGWCEYCDAAFRAYDAIVADLAGTGASLVGIVPERQEIMAATADAKAASFPLVSDVEGHLARLCGLQFELTPAQIDFYRAERGLDLPARHAGTGWELPVPGAYVLDRDGTIAFAFADPDYTRRAEPRELLEAARALGLPPSRPDHRDSGGLAGR